MFKSVFALPPLLLYILHNVKDRKDIIVEAVKLRNESSVVRYRRVCINYANKIMKGAIDEIKEARSELNDHRQRLEREFYGDGKKIEVYLEIISAAAPFITLPILIRSIT